VDNDSGVFVNVVNATRGAASVSPGTTLLVAPSLVPIPAAAPLFVTALAGLGVLARCRQKRAILSTS
jgi:hypothetical protein